MRHYTKFEVGQQHENRKGTYKVLAIRGETMRIRWETGEEIETTTSLQDRILNHMQKWTEQLTLLTVNPTPRKNKKVHV